MTHDERCAKMIFGSVYPMYIAKVERKGRTKAELDIVITWLTGTICGYKIQDIKNPLTKKVRYLDELVDELAKGRAMGKIMQEA